MEFKINLPATPAIQPDSPAMETILPVGHGELILVTEGSI
jgi:hypothetical protein